MECEDDPPFSKKPNFLDRSLRLLHGFQKDDVLIVDTFLFPDGVCVVMSQLPDGYRVHGIVWDANMRVWDPFPSSISINQVRKLWGVRFDEQMAKHVGNVLT